MVPLAPRAMLHSLLLAGAALAAATRFEAEDGALGGPAKVDTQIAGYSGTGYVTDFTDASCQVSIPFSVPQKGRYEVVIGYHVSSGFGDKGFGFQVNGDQAKEGTFNETGAAWSTVSVGIFVLPSTTNTFIVTDGWGYFEVDYIDVSPVAPPSPPPQGRFEAEDGVLGGPTSVDTQIPGYSGTGYVTGFTEASCQVSISFSVPQAGLYEVVVGYHAGFGDKGFGFRLNGGPAGEGTFKGTGSGWATVSAGNFELPSVTNTFTVTDGWGYFEVDYIDVAPASVNPPKPPPKVLSDPEASAEAKKMHSYLVDTFGSRVLTGTQVRGADLGEAAKIYKVSGKRPALVEGGLIDYSPSRVERGANATGLMESWNKYTLTEGNGHGLLSLCWHWNSPCDLMDTPEHPDPDHPWWSGFYTADTNYNISYALANPSSEQYTKLIRDLDAIAVQLAKAAGAGVPVLWRPLHEAAGGWFWWGAQGPAPFKQLWKLMYTRYTQHHALHNLVWVYTADPSAPDWYPGDDVVDIIGMDIYVDAGSSMDTQWEAIKAQFDGKKLIALSETGTFITPSKVRTYKTMWSWFNTWDINAYNITEDIIKQVYGDPVVVTLDQVPDWRA